MAELAALNVKLTGDATGLRSALQSAEGGLERVAVQARQTTQQTAAVSTGMGRLGAAFSRNGFAISNAANQFSDLAVQIGMGVPASRALSQQLPQLTAFMGPLANVIGVASGVLIGLAGNFLATRQNAQDLTNTLEILDRIQGDLNTANEILRMSVVELHQEYGAYAEAVRDAAQSMAVLAEAEARQRMGEMLADMNAALDGFTQRSGTAFRSGTMLSTAIGNIANQFNISATEARELERQFRTLETATTFDQQVEALRQIEQFMEDTGANAADLPPELLAALQQLNQMVIATAEVEGALDNAAAAGARLRASLPMSYGMGLGDQGLTGETAIFGGQAGDVPLGDEDDPARGGRGLSLAERIERDLETLREGFLTQEELQIEAYASQQELLQQALEQRLITQQEYNDLMEQAQQEHARAMSAIDVYRYGSGVAQAQQFMGDMASAFASGNEEMMRIGKAFGAAEALINAWRTYSQVMADPSLPWFAKIPAAVSLLGSAMRAVSAIQGVGKGGSGQRSAGGGMSVGSGGAASAAGATAGGGTSRNVAIQLTGGDMFSRDQVIRLINGINEAVEDGAIVRLV